MDGERYFLSENLAAPESRKTLHIKSVGSVLRHGVPWDDPECLPEASRRATAFLMALARVLR